MGYAKRQRGWRQGNQISDYAGKESNYHPSETLAEAVEDYALNGDAAKALSRVIWDRLKKELG